MINYNMLSLAAQLSDEVSLTPSTSSIIVSWTPPQFNLLLTATISLTLVSCCVTLSYIYHLLMEQLLPTPLPLSMLVAIVLSV